MHDNIIFSTATLTDDNTFKIYVYNDKYFIVYTLKYYVGM